MTSIETVPGTPHADSLTGRRRSSATKNARARAKAEQGIRPTNRLRFRRIAAVLTAGALCTGVVAVAAPSAQAATSITFCFKWSSGAPYAKQPVYLRSYSGNGILATGKTAANGCASWATPSNANVYVQAYDYLPDGPGYQIWNGYSQYYAPVGAGQVGLGTGVVTLIAAG